jgi:selenocysteine lyase/cysteine desulfurase
LQLGELGADFVVLSLYKIAGYPTGLGALVARRSALAELTRPWFSGGTVHWVSVQHGRHRLLAAEEAFEDGTPSFLAVGAVPPALAAVRAAGRDRLARHLRCLTTLALNELTALRHADGSPVVRLHGPREADARGATIALSVHDRAGGNVPYWTVEEAARAEGLALRGGCFCNPGCAERAFAFPAGETRECLEALADDFTVPRFAACLGDRPVGAIRLSLGLGSVRADVTRAVEFFSRYAD